MPRKKIAKQRKPTLGSPIPTRFADVAAIDAAAKERGMGRAAFIRAAVQAQLDGKPIPPRKPYAVEREDMRDIGRVANNVNQTAKALNILVHGDSIVGAERLIQDGLALYGQLNKITLRILGNMR